MHILLKKDSSVSDVGRVFTLASELTGNPAQVSIGLVDGQVSVNVNRVSEPLDPAGLLNLGCIDRIDADEIPYKLAGRSPSPQSGESTPRIIEIPFAHTSIGGDRFVVMAGPCAVENEHDSLEIAHFARQAGASLLRGGAYKPRTSPYSFQGIGDEGLSILSRVRSETGLGIVTEAMEPGTVSRVAEIADIVQIGSRNMHNYPLLKEAGKCGKPVLLKRGMSATLEEWLGAAEYILAGGNPDVILCERGIRTFSRHSRHTLDIGVIPVLRERSSLPVIIDPSHATGAASRVPSMAKAAIAAGADGLLIEIHPDPNRALSDGFQALTFGAFNQLMTELKKIAEATGKTI